MTKLECHNCNRPRTQQPFPLMLRVLQVFIVIKMSSLHNIYVIYID